MKLVGKSSSFRNDLATSETYILIMSLLFSGSSAKRVGKFQVLLLSLTRARYTLSPGRYDRPGKFASSPYFDGAHWSMAECSSPAPARRTDRSKLKCNVYPSPARPRPRPPPSALHPRPRDSPRSKMAHEAAARVRRSEGAAVAPV